MSLIRTIEGYQEAKAVLIERSSLGFADSSALITQSETVRKIIDNVRSKGDAALFDYSQSIDGVKLTQLEVTQDEKSESREKVSKDLVDALKYSAERIKEFHTLQKQKLGLEFEENGLGFFSRPIERVGVYVPGGKASYPSTVLMTVIPAMVAGVDEVIITTPPAKDGSISAATLAAAEIVGAKRVFKTGGAQAIAAMAYGTESIPKVDKICGPGNIYVTLAKKQVYGAVAIDGLHGPTETVVVADDSANAVFCAADLLAQAEHDEMASAVMITTSSRLANDVGKEIEQQLVELDRKDIAKKSLEDSGLILVVKDNDEAIELANLCAAEHLCLSMKNARSYLKQICNAGGVFIDSAEALGDYTAGPSHVMPTGRTARFSSPLSVLDFLKISILVDLDTKVLRELGPTAAVIARAEGLTAHALSVEKRLQELGEGE